MKNLSNFLVAVLLCIPFLFSCTAEPQEINSGTREVTPRSANSSDIWYDFSQRARAYDKKTFPDDRAEEITHRAMYAAALGIHLGSHECFFWDVYSAFWYGWSAICEANGSTRSNEQEYTQEMIEEMFAGEVFAPRSLSAVDPQHDRFIYSHTDLKDFGSEFQREIYEFVQNYLFTPFEATPYDLRKGVMIYIMENTFGILEAQKAMVRQEMDEITPLVMEILNTEYDDRAHRNQKNFLPCFTHLDAWEGYFVKKYLMGDLERDIAELIYYIFPVIAADNTGNRDTHALLDQISRDYFTNTELGSKYEVHRVIMGLYAAAEFHNGFETPFQANFSISPTSLEVDAYQANVIGEGDRPVTRTVNITSNTAWRMELPSSLTTSTATTGTGNGQVSITVPENHLTTVRYFTVTFRYSSQNDGVYDATKVLTIKQAALPLFWFINNSNFRNPKGNYIVHVVPNKNEPFTIVKQSSDSWLTYSTSYLWGAPSNLGSILLKMTANTTAHSRSATFKIYYNSDPSNYQILTVTQYGGRDYYLSMPYITQNYTGASYTITINGLIRPNLFPRGKVISVNQTYNSESYTWVRGELGPNNDQFTITISGTTQNTTDPNRYARFEISATDGMGYRWPDGVPQPTNQWPGVTKGMIFELPIVQGHRATPPAPWL